MGDAADRRPAENQQQDRADIDGQEIEPRLGGDADRAEKRPRRAVDGQRQGIDDRAAARRNPPQLPFIAIVRHGEQRPDIGQRRQRNRPTANHCIAFKPYPSIIPR